MCLTKRGNKVPQVAARLLRPRSNSNGYRPIKSATVIEKDPAKWSDRGIPAGESYGRVTA